MGELRFADEPEEGNFGGIEDPEPLFTPAPFAGDRDSVIVRREAKLFRHFLQLQR